MNVDLSFLTKLDIHPNEEQLFLRALTHKSHFPQDGVVFNNEKLEFLGDAVLDLVLADILMNRFPDDDEGQLSRKKAYLVQEVSLFNCAQSIGLQDHIILGVNERAQGMNQNQRLLASALEALVGALYKDAGYRKVYEWVERQFAVPLQDVQQGSGSMLDHKTRLQELIQAQSKKTPTYSVVDSKGPDHHRMFQVEVLVDGSPLGRGSGASKKAAAQAAAKKALEGMFL